MLFENRRINLMFPRRDEYSAFGYKIIFTKTPNVEGHYNLDNKKFYLGIFTCETKIPKKQFPTSPDLAKLSLIGFSAKIISEEIAKSEKNGWIVLYRNFKDYPCCGIIFLEREIMAPAPLLVGQR